MKAKSLAEQPDNFDNGRLGSKTILGRINLRDTSLEKS